MTDYLPQLALAWSIQMTGALAPGPSVALIAGVALSEGRLPAVLTATGVACGTIVLACATVLGLTAIFVQVNALMSVIRVAGALYLAWLGLKAFRNALHPRDFKVPANPSRNRRHPAVRGFLLQISNPKAIVFWLAIASIGRVGAVPIPDKVLFVAVAFLISFCAHGSYGILLSVPAIRAVYAGIRRWVEGAFGCFFMFASYELATAKL